MLVSGFEAEIRGVIIFNFFVISLNVHPRGSSLYLYLYINVGFEELRLCVSILHPKIPRLFHCRNRFLGLTQSFLKIEGAKGAKMTALIVRSFGTFIIIV